MKAIITESSELAGAAQEIQRVAKGMTKGSYPEKIYISANDNAITLTVENREMSISRDVPAKIEEEGEVLLWSHSLCNAVSAWAYEAVKVTTSETDDGLALECNTATRELRLIGSADKQEDRIFENCGLTEDQWDNTQDICLGIAPRDLEMVNRLVRGCVPPESDERRPVLQAIRVEVDGEDVEFVAADGYKLGALKVKGIGIKGCQADFLISAGALDRAAALGKRMPIGRITLSIWASAGFAVFSGYGFRVVSRLLKGKYPKFDHLFRTGKMAATAVVYRAELRDAMEYVLSVCEENDRMKIQAIPGGEGDGQLIISGAKPGIGDVSASVDAEVEGIETVARINLMFLRGIYHQVSTKMEIAFPRGTEEPVMVSLSEGNLEYRFLVITRAW